MARKSSKFVKWPVAVAECIGLGISLYLALISFGLIHKEGVPCPRGSFFACHSVLKGQYANIGPVPIALLGLIYFLGQLFLTILQTKKGPVRWLKFTGAATGMVFVAYLRSLELVHLKAICPWCWAVAAALLAEVILLYPAVAPPFPRLGWSSRIAAAACGLFLCVGATTAGLLALNEEAAPAEKEEVAEAEEPAPRPKKTPAARHTPKIKKEIAQLPAEPSVTPGKVIARPARTPKPQRKPEEATPEPAPTVLDTPDGRALTARGWRVVGDSDTILKMIQSYPPVLLLAYDPNCHECHGLIHTDLAAGDLDNLRVTKIAIEESRLEGKISDLVKNLPTLLLFDQAGVPRFKHEGRMSARQIARNVQQSTGG